MTLCPRCEMAHYTPAGEYHGTGEPPPPALSRVMGVDICSACGVDEALRDAMGLPPIPPDEWPVGVVPSPE